MKKVFYVYCSEFNYIAKGYGDACQKCAELIKDGHKPKIVIEYEYEV